MHLEAKIHMIPSHTGKALVVNHPIERTIYFRQRPVRVGGVGGSWGEVVTGFH